MNTTNPSPSEQGPPAPTELEVLAAEGNATPAGERLVGQIRAVRDADVQLARRLQKLLSLGGSDFAALQYVRQENEAGRPVRASQLASVTGVTSAASTMLVNRLVRDGHLTREPDPADKRVQRLVISAATRKALDDATAKTREELDNVLGSLSDRETRRATRLLQSVVAALDHGA